MPIFSSSCGFARGATRAILRYYACHSFNAASADSCSREACCTAPLAASCLRLAASSAATLARSAASLAAS